MTVPHHARKKIGHVGVAQVQIGRCRVRRAPGRRAGVALTSGLPHKRCRMLLIIVTAGFFGGVDGVGKLRGQRLARLRFAKRKNVHAFGSRLVPSNQLHVVFGHRELHGAAACTFVHGRFTADKFPAFERAALRRACGRRNAYRFADAHQLHRLAFVIFVDDGEVAIFRAIGACEQVSRDVERVGILDVGMDGTGRRTAQHHLRARRYHEVLPKVDGCFRRVLLALLGHRAALGTYPDDTRQAQSTAAIAR